MRFARFVRAAMEADQLIVQPRMGFDSLIEMRAGLKAVRDANALSIGTITLDSYTRVGDHQAAALAIQEHRGLNGYPIVVYGADVTREMLDGIQGDNFPIQVRHGCAKPLDIFQVIKDAGIDATEGGPVSYCLPYGRVPLAESIDAWARCCDLIAARADEPEAVHLESFGGCMLGQMCPPSLLIAMSILEGIFFLQHGVHSISLSYAQQTDQLQDVAALHALRLLATEHLGAADWHVVLYTYMGVFPKTPQGSQSLLAESVRLARMGGAQRLIVKTVAEAHRIPTVAENIEALEFGSRTWQSLQPDKSAWFNFAMAVEIYDEASQLVNAVRNLHPDIGVALRMAFESGYLDIPYCLHKDNQGRSRSYIDAAGRLQWHAVGRMPITAKPSDSHKGRLDPFDFLEMLSTVEHRFDNPHYSTTLVGHRSNSVCRPLSIPKHH